MKTTNIDGYRMKRTNFHQEIPETHHQIEGGTLILFNQVFEVFPEDVLTIESPPGHVKAGRRVSDCIGYALNTDGGFDSFLVKLAKSTGTIETKRQSL